MLDAALVLDPAFAIAEVQRRTFGSFVEHMGRCVYTGIYEPGHPSADQDGHRGDVLDLAREMGITLVRYPGGNFVSGYRWEDGVGPVEHRPTRLDAAWHSLETNEHGLGEFMVWADKAEVEVNLAMNLGTRGVESAVDLFEYCNHPRGTYWSDLRIEHGYADPFDVRLWCLGNELDGPWQMGHKTAHEYGRLAAETARALRRYDPGLELVVCGSSGRDMPTFGYWEATVLEQAYEQVDLISAHAYYGERDGDTASFLASADDMEAFIQEVVATADHVGAKLRDRKRIDISFDEWNVWHHHELAVPTDEWPVAPRLAESAYNVADAVVVGSLLITLLRRSDRVTAACQAQLVNVLAPIHSEPAGPAWRHTSFYPFAHAARLAWGRVLQVETHGPVFANERFAQTTAIHAVATHDPETDEIVLFAVNRHPEEDVRLTLRTRSFPGHRVHDVVRLSDDDLRAANTRAEPARVVPQQVDERQREGNDEQVLLPAVSWNVIRLRG